jgi:hypothetical protein
VANGINLNINTSELIADKGGSTDVQIVIKFPPGEPMYYANIMYELKHQFP